MKFLKVIYKESRAMNSHNLSTQSDVPIAGKGRKKNTISGWEHALLL